MNINETIKQLKDLKAGREKFLRLDVLGKIAEKDIEALDVAIAALMEKDGDTNAGNDSV